MTMLHLLKKFKNQYTVLPLSRQYCDSAASAPTTPVRRIVRRSNRVVRRKKMAGGIKIDVKAGCKCCAPAVNAMSPAPAKKRTIGEMLDSIRGVVEAMCCVGFFVAYFYDRRGIAKMRSEESKMRSEESSNKDEQLKQQVRLEKGKKEPTK